MAETIFRRHELNDRVVGDLRKRSLLGFFFYLTVPFCIFLTDGYYQRCPSSTLWLLGFFILLILFRLSYQLFWTFSPRSEPNAHGMMFLGVLATAITWGAIATGILSRDGEAAVRLVTIICTAGFCSGGVIAFTPDKKLSILYNLLILLPLMIVLLAGGKNFGLGVATALYALYLILVSIRGNAEYWTALENEFLLARKTEELERQSRIDPLTNLYNRRSFHELFQFALGLCIRKESPVALVMCDVDRFKEINDTHGHLAGDEYLKLIGRCLHETFKRETDIIGRFGGEEFVVLMPDEQPSNAVTLAESFRILVSKSRLEYNGAEIVTTVSLGLTSCIPGNGMTLERLLDSADKALYDAKNSGRNRVMVRGMAGGGQESGDAEHGRT